MEDLNRKAIIVKIEVFSQEEQVSILTWMFPLMATA